MTITELNKKLDKELKLYLKKGGFVDTGSLVKSIKFKCKFNNDKFDIKFDSNDYIQYLDDGNLLDNFFGSKEVKNILGEFLANNISDIISDSL